MKKLIVIALALVVSSCALAATHKLEKDYQRPWCAEHKGELEVVLDDGARVDCVTDTNAIEFDFGHKWAESLGQALYYGTKTGKRAGIVLIVEADGDRYLARLKAAIEHYKLPVDVWTVAK